jgi:Right handed beta helix region
MSKIAFLLTLLVTVLVGLLPAAPAQAQAGRTFLSATGSDSNNCTNVTSPCRHLAAAYAATAPNGEIYVLDPANYGSLTITHGVSIEGHGWASIAPVSGGNAITINANPGDAINIIGVVLDGTALANTTGIVFNSGGSLTVADSVIRNFGVTGLYINPTSTSLNLLISNTQVLDNPTVGIDLAPPPGGYFLATLDRVTANNNGYGIFINGGVFFAIDRTTVNSNNYGIYMTNASGALQVEGTITNSIISSNSTNGITAVSPGSRGVSVSIKDSSVSNHAVSEGLVGISVANNCSVFLSQSLIANNITGIAISGNGVVRSAGNNDISNNNTPITGGSLGSAPEQ